MLEKLEYELEFITPAFIGGANPGEVSELRPASIVGMLRYWFRVIVGAFVESTEELFKLESELFGNQEKAGKVWVRVKDKVCKKLDKCVTTSFNEDSGKIYLGYGNILYLNFKENKNHRRDYKLLYNLCREKSKRLKGFFFVKPMLSKETTANIEIITPEKLRKKIEALIYIFSQIGALGARNRRGWGSLYLKPTKSNKYENYLFNNWSIWDKDELIKAMKILTGTKNFEKLPFEIYRIKKEHNTPLEALEFIGKEYKEFRYTYEPDYSNVKRFLLNPREGKKIIERESVKRAYLGMPIIFRFSSDKRLKNKSVEVKTNTGRFASPMHIRIIRLLNGKYTSLIIHKKDVKKPSKVNVILKERKEEKERLTFHELEESIFYEFIDNLKRKNLIENEEE